MAFVLDFKAIDFDLASELIPAMICFNNLDALFFMLTLVTSCNLIDFLNNLWSSNSKSNQNKELEF